MIYYDTAFLAKCYLREPGYKIVRAHAEQVGRIACCEVGKVELMSVFHRHWRERRLDVTAFNVVVEQFRADEAAGVWRWLPATSALLAAAARSFEDLAPSVFLRAADALHLQCVKAAGLAEIFTSDRHLLAASSFLGVRGRNLLDGP